MYLANCNPKTNSGPSVNKLIYKLLSFFPGHTGKFNLSAKKKKKKKAPVAEHLWLKCIIAWTEPSEKVGSFPSWWNPSKEEKDEPGR